LRFFHWGFWLRRWLDEPSRHDGRGRACERRHDHGDWRDVPAWRHYDCQRASQHGRFHNRTRRDHGGAWRDDDGTWRDHDCSRRGDDGIGREDDGIGWEDDRIGRQYNRKWR
jgi:hypothetical protein